MHNDNQYSISNYYSDYVKQGDLKGHAKPILVKNLENYIPRAKNSICKIKYYDKNYEYYGTGFFFR